MGDPKFAFIALHDNLRRQLSSEAVARLEILLRMQPRYSGTRGFENLGAEVVNALNAVSKSTDPAERTIFSRALIAKLGSNAIERISSRNVTPRVVERAQEWHAELLKFLSNDQVCDYWFPNDYFLKDYRFVTGLTVPCGAQVVDLSDGIGPKTALKIGRQSMSLSIRAIKYPWFQIHTESRYLDEFNEAGWDRCYVEIANLLDLHPDIQGIVGTSWFYDPALESISPRLSYLRAYPMRNGAICVKQGTTAFDIKSATATSSTRQQLYEAGSYMPVCYTIVWPREKMLAYANKRNG
jgi:hypothetical protein